MSKIYNLVTEKVQDFIYLFCLCPVHGIRQNQDPDAIVPWSLRLIWALKEQSGCIRAGGVCGAHLVWAVPAQCSCSLPAWC